MQGFRFALAHVPPDAKAGELDAMRCCLAYLYWDRKEYRDAASLGESLARGDPDRQETQQGAKIALAACARLFNDAAAKGDGKEEKERMVGIARFIADRWPGTPLADDAQRILVQTDEANAGREP